MQSIRIKNFVVNIKQRKTKSMMIFLFVLFLSGLSFYANVDAQNGHSNKSNEFIFSFTGQEETFIVPETGLYTIEAWGAEGGNLGSVGKGGKGGFVSGEIELKENDELYINVGGQGDSFSRGYNGGGQKFSSLVFGGGASDVRVSGRGLMNRILVAGGGGSSTLDYDGGFGGGLIAGIGQQSSPSNHASYLGRPGTQDKPGISASSYPKVSGLFGIGGDSYQSNSYPLSGAGGGGWYGGSGSLGQVGNQNSAGGGSSYVLSENSFKPNLYSPSKDYYFKNFKNIAGNEQIVNEDGLTSIGRSGDGYIRIKFFPQSTMSDTKLDAIRINNVMIPAFQKDVNEYNIYVDGEYSETDFIVVDKRHPQQVVEGDGLLQFKTGDFSRIIFVKSADGLKTSQYKLNFIREKSTKLKSIKFGDYEFKEGLFDSNVFSYELDAFRQGDIPVVYQTYSNTAEVVVEGLDTLVFGENTVKVTVTNGESVPSVYTFKINRKLSLDYSFKGQVQEFVAPYTGKYKFDLWGAQGGNFDQVTPGGKGGFTSGVVQLNKGEVVYVYVGGDGSEAGKGFNGGGKSIKLNHFGGGASDIRIAGTSYFNRILIAGGGGASTSMLAGGYGGGLTAGRGLSQGSNASWFGGPGTQTGSSGYVPGQFGVGGDSYSVSSYPYSAAGGGGFYGGGGSVSQNNQLYSGGGGSSYVLDAQSVKPEGMNPSTQYYASKSLILAGNESMFDINGNRSIGQTGHGHIRITHLADNERQNPQLEMIRFKGLDIPNFKSDVFQYTIELEGDYVGFDEISVDKIHDDQVVSQNIYHDFLYHDKEIVIGVSSADKKYTQNYTLNFVRKPSTKLFSLGVKNYLFEDEIEFNKDIYAYEVSTFRDDPIELEYITFDKNAKVQVTGLNDYSNGNDTITIKVSVVGEADKTYTIKVNRKQYLEYDFKGKVQHFYAPYTGKYIFEVWGAQGFVFPENLKGSYGGFVSGEVNLKEGELVYIYTGGAGDAVGKGFNGGGSSYQSNQYGGGASDIRIGGISPGNRILVAGGGGASTHKDYFGGRGGGLTAERGQSSLGATASFFGGPGTQLSSSGYVPGTFGSGAVSYKGGGHPLSAGGGGGWYGGGGSVSSVNNYNGGGGGSSYIFNKTSVKPSGYNMSPNYYVENGQMPAFNESFFDVDGTRVDGRSGHGHIRISYDSSIKLDSTQLEEIHYNGSLIENFKPEVRDYTIKITGEHQAIDELSVSKQHSGQIAVFDKNVNLNYHNHTELITVISADGQSTGEYLIHFVREDSTKLAELSVDEYKFSFTKPFNHNDLNYDLSSYVYGEIKIHFKTFNEDATVVITGEKENQLRPGNNRVLVKVSHPNPEIQDTTYEINVYRMRDMEFGYSGKQEKFSIPYTGIYKFEAWGAQGYSDPLGGIGGKGGYSVGEIFLRKGEIVYLNVGGAGDMLAKGYNGGGKNNGANMYGGGATDIRMGGTGLLYRNLVAGGGGSASGTLDGGAGGGLNGINGVGGSYPGFGGTQNSSKGYTNGVFGIGAEAYQSGGWPLSAGGGGGWYGGGSSLSQVTNLSSAGGGSSYLLTATSERMPNHVPSIKYFLSETKTISGNELMPGKDDHSVIGNEGNGFIKVSLLNLYGVDSSLEYLNFSHGVPNKSFDKDILEYDLVLEPDQTTLKISADTIDHNASVAWDNEKIHTIKPGITRFELIVTAQDGSTRIYVVRVHRSPSSNSQLKDLTVGGLTIDGFSPEKLNYDLHLTYDQNREMALDWEKSRPNQVITGEKSHLLENGVPISVEVISEDNTNTSTYIINPIIEDSNLLKTLSVDEVVFDFDANINEYNLLVPSGVSSLNITAIAFDHEALVTMTGNGYIRNGLNVVQVMVTEPHLPVNIYTLNVTRSDSADGSVDTEYDFIYKGEVEYYEIPYTGNYKIESWGAEGGNRGGALGGQGGYSKGIVKLNKGEVIAIYVGGAGTSAQAGFNGGAVSGTPNVYGGGASDVRIGEYTLNDRIIVAGGGGSVGAINKPGAAGGGLLGLSNNFSYGSGGQGGSQTTAGNRGAFGLGGEGLSSHGGRGGGGGGGWFGGGGANPDYGADDDRGGGGGSGYVLTESSHKPSGYNVPDKYYLSDVQILSGNEQIPNKDGGFVQGNKGNGFVRITSLRRASTDNHLERIDLDGGITLEPAFDTETYDYTLNLDVNQTEITVKGVPMDPFASITGNGTYSIPSTGKNLVLNVVSESGDLQAYTIQINRPASNSSTPKDIVITGLIPSLCGSSEEYCKLSPEFNPVVAEETGVNVYSMIVPSRIRSIEFSVIKQHEYQTAIGEEVIELNPGSDNVVTIMVMSEDGSDYSTYIFNIDRDMTGNADLEKIDILDPVRDLEFNPDVTEYYFSVPNEIENTSQMEWDVTAMDPLAEVLISGEGALKMGTNSVTFTVVANNGLTKVYTLNIYREDNSNTFLKRLIVTHNEEALLIAPSFNKTLHDYVLTVENEVDQVKILAEAEAADTTTVLNGEDGIHNLVVGQNNISLLLTAEDGTTSTYKITIIRKPSSNAMIEAIKINGSIVDAFNPELLTQTITIDSQTIKPKFEIELTNEYASHVISGSFNNFKPGLNPVYIRVTAEDGTIRAHTIIFDKEVSGDSTLSSIKSNLFDITNEFDKDVTEYNLNIPYSEAQMMIEAVPTHGTSTVNGGGGYYLTSGKNTLKLNVVAEDNTSTTYTFEINMLKNNNPELKELNLSEGVFNPDFSSKITEYAINVSNETDVIAIKGIPTIASTKVSGDGEYILNTGLNIIKVSGTSESGAVITYTLNVTRDVSSNADLSYLVVHEGALSRAFLPGVIEYDVIVPNGTRRLTIEASVKDPFATYTILNASALKDGLNTVIVRVTPQNKVGVKDYTLNVFVQTPAAENINLTDLKVSAGKLSPDFLPTRPFYRVKVGNEVSTINVNALVAKGIEVQGNGDHALDVGNNIIVIKTKASNGVTKDYQVEVNRAPSSDTQLQSLQLSVLSSNYRFRPEIYVYNVSTRNNALTINPVTMHPKATTEIIGNENFTTNTKTIVLVRVTAEDGITKQDYVINVSKEASKNNSLKSLSITGINFTPEFTPSKTTYTAQASQDVTQVVVSAQADDINAKVVMDKVHTLTVGQNFIDIVVVSESNEHRKYTVVVEKEGSKVRDLSALSVDGVSVLNFDKDTLIYEYTYEYEKESIFIDYELLDKRSTITGVGELALNVGMNVLPITVTSENGDTKIYTIKVNRKEINSAEIDVLTVDQYPVDNFLPTKENYNLIIDNEFSKLRFNIKLKDPKASFIIEGNDNLTNGNNTIKVTVKSSRLDKEKTYTFNVFKQEYGNNTLAYLEIDKGEMKPQFFGGQMLYHVELSYEYSDITITGEALEASATPSNLGKHELAYGMNHIKIPVKANNGVIRTYHLMVNRSRSNDNYLNSLRVEAQGEVFEFTPKFDPKVNEYTLTKDLKPGTDFVNLAITSNADNVVGHNQQKLVVGQNKLKIKVTSDSGLENIYTINMNRPASSNNSLVNIKPSSGGLAPNFIYTENKYTLNVDTATTTLYFDVNTEDKNATVSGHEKQIVEVGTSQRMISVKAENGDIKQYTIDIVKNDTNNAYLKSLQVLDGVIAPKFDESTFTYELTVPNDKKMIYASEIKFVAADSNATVALSGNLNLVTGVIPNVYEIRVTAIDGFTSLTYRINIFRESSKEAVIEELEFSSGTLNKPFNSFVYNYDLEFSSETLKFNKNTIKKLITSDPKTVITYSHDGDIELKEGVVTPFKVKATSEDGSNFKEYVFNITYTRSKDNKLSNILIDEAIFKPEFSPDVLNYEVSVHEDVRAIVLKAFARDPKAKVLSILGDKELTNHTTNLEIKVQAENGSVLTYTLSVKRNLSNKINLKNIELTDSQNVKLSPVFNDLLSQYEATVPRNNDHVGLAIEKGHESQIITLYDKFNNILDINNFDLIIGRNQFKLEVKSPFDDVNGERHIRYIHFLIIRDGNANNFLESMNVTDPTLDIAFDKEQMEYFIEVANSYDSITINTKAEVDTSTVEVINNQFLKQGNNDVIVRVTAENGDVRNYIIHVFKAAKFNNFLQNITVSEEGVVISNDPKFFTPSFYRGTTTYRVEVGSNIKKVSVQGIAFDDDVIVTGKSSSETSPTLNGVEVTLQPGNNMVTLTSIEPTEGNVMIYTVNIVRKMSEDVSLLSLRLEENNQNLEFDEGEYNPLTNFYTTEVGPDTTSVSVFASALNPNARVTITGNETIHNGENLIKVTVTSEDRTKTKVYTILVKKNLSSNTALDALNITHGDEAIHNFDMEALEFNYSVPKNVDSVTVDGSVSDPLADVNGFGLHSIVHGPNKLSVKVKAQNGDVKEYIINVMREYDNDLESLKVNQGMLTPEFSEDVFDYTVWVPVSVDKINVEGIAKNAPVASVTGNGWHDLKMGSDNLIKISVQSSLTDVPSITTVKVIRSASPNFNLASLEIDQGLVSPEFDASKYEFETYINNSNTVIDLTIIPEDPKASYVILDNPNAVVNPTDKNKVKISKVTDELTPIVIRVTAENGEYKDTTLLVHRQPAALFSNLLSSLEVTPVKSISPNVFNPLTNNYVSVVEPHITFITIKATKQSADARIVSGVGTFAVEPGRNVYSIVVRSKDGVDNVYKVHINQVVSADASLSDLSFDEGFLTPVFSRGRTTYTMNVGASTNFLNATVVPFASGTTWTIQGGGFDQDLVMGENIITIDTLAANKIGKSQYVIKVNKTNQTSVYLNELKSNVGEFDKPFDKYQEGPYVLEIGADVNSLILSGKAQEPASVDSISGLGIVDMAGINNKTVEITVLGKAGNKMTYFVEIVKTLNEDVKLSYLSVNPGTLNPVFNPDNSMYDVKVGSDVESIEILANTNGIATISGLGIKQLKPGMNQFKVSLTTDNGLIGIYTINVEREIVSSANILNIRFKEALIDAPIFDKDELNYQLYVPNEVKQLTLDHIELEDPINSEYEFVNPILKDGNNTVEVIVTNKKISETKTYTFNVTRYQFSSNFLSQLSTNEGLVSPSFDKELNNYDIEVAYDVSEIELIGRKEDGTASETGLGVHKNLKVGINELKVVVTSSTNVPRTYIVRVNRLADSSKDLLTLIVEGGVITPIFGNSEFNEYTVNMNPDTNIVKFTGTIPETASATGLESLLVTESVIEHEIIVTAQDKTTQKYRFTINKQLSSDAGVINILPSSGDMVPVFDPISKSYSVVVPDEINKLDFTVTTRNRFAEVSGHESRQLSYGDNEYKIKTISENRLQTSEYDITVTREKDIQSIEIKPDNVVMNVKDTHTFEHIILPTDANTSDLVWTSTDDTIASVDQFGVVSAHKVGSVQITAHSKKNPNIKSTAVVEILNLRIESDILEIVRDAFEVEEIKDYVWFIGFKTSKAEFLTQFTNEISTLKLYTSNGTLIGSEEEIIGTEMVIKLEVNGQVYDELKIVLLGDMDGDGEMSPNDYAVISRALSSLIDLNEVQYVAADVDLDDSFSPNDVVLVQRFLGGLITDITGKGE